MIVVLFEAWTAAIEKARYLEFAAALRSELDSIDGFVSIERFEGLSERGKIQSLPFFRDEAAFDAAFAA